MDKFSFLNAIHPSYIAELYDKYLKAPDSLEPSWRSFFQGFDFGLENGTLENSGLLPEDMSCESVVKEFQVIRLIDAYRHRGHLFTKTNPVRARRTYEPTLALENFGLSKGDLQTVFQAGEVIAIKGGGTLQQIVDKLENAYCGSIGFEYMYIEDTVKLEWIQNWISDNKVNAKMPKENKIHILEMLNKAVSFETFLHTKYVGQKRFSLEGGESLIPALDALVENAAEQGVEDFVMGMAHRGRLSTLTNIFGKNTNAIFGEFDGKDYDQDNFAGDVMYHLGWTSERVSATGKKINLNMAPNPSHLETVGSVVEGIVRAKQDVSYPEEPKKVLPIIVHGDSAIAGQGIAYEIVQMAQLDGYKTNGTIHIVVNNQVGFTTNYLDARSSTYCTDVAKVTLSPVVHVNADDAEEVVRAARFALDYRMKFGGDVFIDMLGYRKYGHNEGDEPRFTQPKLYDSIGKHKNVRDLYADVLIEQKVIEEGFVKKIEKEFKDTLETSLEDSRKEETTTITPIMQDKWKAYKQADQATMLKTIDTTYAVEKLDEVAKVLGNLPEDKEFIRKITRLIGNRKDRYFKNNNLDWAMAELLAYGSLVEEGYNVRISGQDVERGTFSHRHAVIKTASMEEEVVQLRNIPGAKGKFNIFNSLLSEYGVVGFDYGYALGSPDTLTIWEAQFGDFSNGAQIMIDQYISAAEDKWNIQNGLVMLLPHGYEGQGAEHSSARMERYLQLCADDNMFVVDCTTPANMFHLLRRQVKATYRKPLIVFTPKSLLRHPLVVSTKEDFAEGSFQMLIDDATAKASKVKKVVFVTGKFYYDLLSKREELGRTGEVALVRIEQLFPLPKSEIRKVIKKYKNATDVVWAQEEPKNMGAYMHMLLHLEEAKDFRVCSQDLHAAPAAGSSVRAKVRHEAVLDNVFNKK